MSDNIDLLPSLPEDEKNQIKKTKKPIRFLAYSFIFLIIAFVLFSASANESNQNSSSWLDKIPGFKQFKHLAESADKNLKGEADDRINILLLGMGGDNHEGGYLTDTLILASIKPSEKKISMLSIPRDLTIPMENGSGQTSWRKINNVNACAEVENKGSGGLAVSQAISDVLNVPIDYYVRADFVGFEKIIDELGGIEVEVENTINDYSYPIMGNEEIEPYENRFEHLYIEKGLKEMDGSLALKYVRSRHTAGIEGSDFARARRQQKAILAAKEKFLATSVLAKPKLITDIIGELQDHVSTNLKIWEIVKLWSEFKDVKSENITNKVLDNSPNGMLIDMINEDGAYVLYPRSGDFEEIQYLVNNIFSDAPRTTKTKVTTEEASVEVRNGTWINGLASEVAVDLEKYGFNIIRVGNSGQQNFQKSVIYDLTYGEKMESLIILKEKTKANVSLGLPQWLIDNLSEELSDEKNPEQPDFILVLGQDADKTGSGGENINE